MGTGSTHKCAGASDQWSRERHRKSDRAHNLQLLERWTGARLCVRAGMENSQDPELEDNRGIRGNHASFISERPRDVSRTGSRYTGVFNIGESFLREERLQSWPVA